MKDGDLGPTVYAGYILLQVGTLCSKEHGYLLFVLFCLFFLLFFLLETRLIDLGTTQGDRLQYELLYCPVAKTVELPAWSFFGTPGSGCCVHR